MNFFKLCVLMFVALSLTTVVHAAENDSLESAYIKEFIFLENQKRGLQDRIARLKQEIAEQQAAEEKALQGLQARQFEQEKKAQRLNQWILETEQQLSANESQQITLQATYEQAETTLKDYDVLQDKTALQSLSHQQRLQTLFDDGAQLLQTLSAVQTTAGRFFNVSGREVSGQIIKLGNVARYGVSDTAAGVLVPVGGGELQLWSEPAANVAQTLANGSAPALLKIFLYEDVHKAVEDSVEKNALQTIASGGAIAWVIVALGVLAILMIALRSLFLKRASVSAATLVDNIAEQVRAGEVKAALSICEKTRGATARVVAATLRNINRNRDHVEDIISEGILHESSYLNRYGAIIMVIAAVSPLLGLLGTVTGMISTFDVITQFGTGDPKLLSGGISVALVTTQLGLVVAIPVLILGNLLNGWSNRIKDDMEKSALRVMNLYERDVRVVQASAQMVQAAG